MNEMTWLILFILFIIGLFLFSGWGFSKAVNSVAKTFAKAFADELERLERQKERRNKLGWLCPICGELRKEPATHLKEAHNISDDMIQFWIEKGRWL